MSLVTAPIHGELAHVVAGIARADQRLEHRAAGEGGHRGAVARRLVGEEFRRPDAAGARHHLHVDERMAGDVLAEMAADHAGIEIDAAAGGAGDIDA